MIPKNKTRVNVTLKNDVVKYIDESVEIFKLFDKTINRSKFIELVLEGFMASQNNPKLNAQIEKILKKEIK